jgi:hypothetical protein
MPYRDKERDKWCGTVWIKKIRYRDTNLFDTRAEAKAWEAEERKKVLSNSRQVVQSVAMDFLTLYEEYLDLQKIALTDRRTFVAKPTLGRRFLAFLGVIKSGS